MTPLVGGRPRGAFAVVPVVVSLVVGALLGATATSRASAPRAGLWGTSDAAPPAAASGAAVCLTGQLERLELESKVWNFFGPLHEAYGEAVDVVLVLSEDDAEYTNVDSATAARYTKTTALAALKTASAVGEVVWVDLEETAVPNVPLEYAAMLTNEDYDDQVERARNNVRMVRHYDTCARALADLEVARGAPYALASHAREDLYFVVDVDVGGVADALVDADWVTPDYDDNGGVNDKIAIYAGRDAGRILPATIEELMFFFTKADFQNAGGRGDETINTEKLIKYSVETRRGLVNAPLPNTVLAVAPYRAFSDGSECLHINVKADLCAGTSDLVAACGVLERRGVAFSANLC